ncbi:uncharacterized protein AKAW2_11139S [Aspergillus luchuensis]|uniref:Phosphatidylinositol UDP-GlcNAc transferase PIG-C n=1 Tax=Aspergillus kawachii TaxID=1069201 RepID=A0A146FFC7_ASPKA|nr:uncharacterized protein AKAW2_11139S [Aspergillus luchuensis]BCR94093.1 hypothetical protein AKAW2_11139S [Aspergillus luchuensis]BCS06703.1 hypothetical protein ALUC_11084S [Aspergillus luchuensis]GAT24041.1 phosphatidylinositol UDP-GlcNAc transferase PIG-C [Aspergillus luchuensis]
MNPADGAVIFWKERVRRASRHIVHTESDDEEQKPTVSADGSQAGSNDDQAVHVNAKPELGPDIPFPSYLMAILEHWHEEKGYEYPRCKVSGRLGSMVWKVFDRKGNELELTWYLVTKPRKYCVLVLHEANGTARFVYCDPPHRTVHGTYLRPWSGVDEKEELEHCAVRVFSSDLEEIEYSSEAWEHLKELQDSSGEDVSRSPSVTRRKSPKDKIVTRELVKAGCSKRYSMRGRAHQSEEHTEADSSSSSEAGSSSEEEKYVPSPPHKRHKTTDTSNTSNTTEPMKPSKVVFRLGSQRVIGAIRYIPLDECRSRKELFDKATAFYQACDRDAQVKILACQISTQREQHYLFEDSDGEFRLLVEQALGLVDNLDRIVIDVLHVLQA